MLNIAIKWGTREKKHAEGHREIEKITNLLSASDKINDMRITWLYNSYQAVK
jgi:hypothetical protein